MITSKELGYVFKEPTRVPYPGIDYAYDATDKLIVAYHDYKKYYYDKQYDIVLSNGEQITFEILKMNLCHMLGIKATDLMNPYFNDFRQSVLKMNTDERITSFDLLEALIEHIDEVTEYDFHAKGKILNYYRLMVKCSIFEKLSDFSRFDFGVINFDKEYYNNTSSVTTSIKSEKLLYVQSNEPIAPYFIMGILPNNGERTNPDYVVETLFAPENPQSFFNCQEVTIPTQILINSNNDLQKIEATPSEKIALLNQYRAIVERYNIPNRLNIFSDYESVLATQSAKSRTRRNQQASK